MLDDDRDYEGYGNNAKKGLKKRDREREKRRDEGVTEVAKQGRDT